MRDFTQLFARIDSTTSTNAKVEAMQDYFSQADAADAAWAVFFLSGKRIKRLISTRLLREWLITETRLPEWLVEECYNSVGDSAETIALLLPEYQQPSAAEEGLSLRAWIEERILPLKDLSVEQQQATVTQWWRGMDTEHCFVLNKLLTGALRVGVSRLLVARALSACADLPKSVILHRLMGDWDASAEFFQQLIDPDTTQARNSQPYPFFLASPLETEVRDLGPFSDWQAEWKWDGIRAQLIKRDDQVFIWSRGEELMTPRFPEIIEAAEHLPNGVVLDGELLAWNDQGVLPFSELQRRIGRKNVSKKMQKDVPIRLLCYDLMEYQDNDIRMLPLRQRRQTLDDIVDSIAAKTTAIANSPIVVADDWEGLAQCRQESRKRLVEGLMLKHQESLYETGRKRGHWWKWKIEPYTIDAVMIYAQAGHGRRANLFTDYTFAVWQDGHLLPVAKAYSGLTDKEILRLDRWIRKNTKERFGPVRSVEPVQVFEIAFENIALSKRHKSGIAVRFPRIVRWRQDLKPQDAEHLDQLHDLIKLEQHG